MMHDAMLYVIAVSKSEMPAFIRLDAVPAQQGIMHIYHSLATIAIVAAQVIM